MRVRDLMTTNVRTIEADESIDRARAAMEVAGIHQLVVRSGRGQVVGVISLADVRAAPKDGTVGDFMSPRLWIVRPDTSLGSAAAFMRAHAIGSLPVIDRARLVGILTVSDLLDFVDRYAQTLGHETTHRRRRCSANA
jgi:CBS domain-containing protein